MSNGALRWLWVLPLLVAAVAYAPAFQAERVWDDQTVQEEMRAFHAPADVLHPPAGIATWTYSYFRPGVIVSYLADDALFGFGAARGPHLANVLYLLLVTLLVFLLAGRLLAGRPGGEAGAVVAALLFAVHPIHTESVSWIAGRSDLLATLFLLPALILSLRWRDRGGAMALLFAALSFLLALLCKEVAITGLALIPLVLLLAPRADAGAAPPVLRYAGIGGALLGVLAVYVWLRGLAGIQPAGIQDLPATERVTRLLGAAAWYLGKLVVPWPQANIVGWQMVPGGLASGAVLAAALLGTAFCAARLWRAGDGAPLLGVGWIWITLSVPLWSAVGAVSNTPLAERQLFLPSIGAAVLAALALTALRARFGRAAALLVLAVVVGAYGAGTWARGLVWQDDLALWTAATRSTPDSGLAWMNLGMARLRAGDDRGALAAIARALAANNDPARLPRLQFTAGTLELRLRNLAAAEEHFRAAIAMQPADAEPFYGLGAVYRARAGTGTGRESAEARDLAVNFFGEALGRNAGYHPARLMLAASLAERGRVLGAAGDAAGAGQDLAAARAALAKLLSLLPAERHAEAVQTLRRETGVDADELARSLGAL